MWLPFIIIWWFSAFNMNSNHFEGEINSTVCVSGSVFISLTLLSSAISDILTREGEVARDTPDSRTDDTYVQNPS